MPLHPTATKWAISAGAAILFSIALYLASQNLQARAPGFLEVLYLQAPGVFIAVWLAALFTVSRVALEVVLINCLFYTLAFYLLWTAWLSIARAVRK